MSYKLYGQLFGPVAARLPAVPHLIFEPDGAMLRLPINLLITADTGLADYERRLRDPDADPFDMRQIAWLGRTSRPSTPVSTPGFRNARPGRKSVVQGKRVSVRVNPVGGGIN